MLRRVLDLQPWDREAIQTLSSILRDRGKLDEALRLATDLVSLQPDHAWGHVQIGNVLVRQTRHSEAASAYRTALTLRCDLEGVPEALAYAAEAAGDIEAAAEALSVAAAADPGDKGRMRRVAALYARLGRKAEEELWLRRAGSVSESISEPVAEACRRFPHLPPDVTTTPIQGGDHNTVFRLRAERLDLALRLGRFPPRHWYLFCEEKANATIAQRAGIAPDLLHFDPADGTMLTHFIDGSLDDEDFHDPALARKAGLLYRTLHSGPRFQGVYDILNLVESTRRGVDAIRIRAVDGFDDLEKTVSGLITDLRRTQGPPAPCHNDPVSANFLLDGERLVLLDWQCSGMTDPHWELAAFIAQLQLPPASEQAFLAAAEYPGGAIGRRRIEIYKAVCRWYWMLKALTKQAEGTGSSDWRHVARRNAQSLRHHIGVLSSAS